MPMRSNVVASRRQFLQSAAAAAAMGVLGSQHAVWAAEGDLIVRTADPFNAEPPLNALTAERLTPAKHFYVRNHGPMPNVDARGFKVRIEGMVQRPLELSLNEIRERFRQIATEATLTCAGNRRQEMSAIKPVGGVQWDAGAIGHARWQGAPLAEVLRAAGIKADAKHVWFEGLDPIKEKDGSVAPFGGSIPIEKVIKGDAECLLAYAMNDSPLTAEYGFPLRSIVPGYIGARSVKWLTKITVSDRPSPNHYLAEAYQLVQSDDKTEVARAEPIYTFPVNAAICASGGPKAGPRVIRGYALPSGEPGSTIAKVEVSRDGGKTWMSAKVVGEAKPYAWQHWTAEVNLPPGKHELVVRATDSRASTMPERAEWNFKGYLYNGWHRVQVEAT